MIDALVARRLGAFVCAGLLVAFIAASAQAETGIASFYGGKFHDRKTASGERFNQNAMTAAHRTLPFGTCVRVAYRGRSVVVRITDRGPFIKGRKIDLSKAAAQRLGLPGVGRVTISRAGRGC